MALRIKLSKDDMAGSKLLTPGWYLAQLDKFTQRKASTDGSDLIQANLKTVEDGHGNGGVPLLTFFSEKAMWKWGTLLESFGITVTADQEYDIDSFVGQQVDVYIDNQEYKSEMRNNVVKFAPAGKMSQG